MRIEDTKIYLLTVQSKFVVTYPECVKCRLRSELQVQYDWDVEHGEWLKQAME